MQNAKMKNKKRERRHTRTRAKILGTSLRPRLSAFRSNKHIFLQLIDDRAGKTLLAIGDAHLKLASGKKGKPVKIDTAREVGRHLAGLAKKKNIKRVIFDKGKYAYHGRIRAAAEGAREGGLIF